MNALLRFLSRMDATAARTVFISAGLFALVAAIFITGKFVLGIEPGDLEIWFDQASSSWYALPLTIAVFTALSFLGAPQFGLIAAAVLAFGPWTGFWFAWIATMCAASVNFAAGRLMGADFIRRYGGDTVNRISDFVGRNGFWASMVIRVLPSAPFVVVNAAAGASAMRATSFLAGTAIGIIPKTALVAFASEGLMALIARGNVAMGALLLLGAAASIGAILGARAWFRRKDARAAKAPVQAPASGAEPLAIDPASSHKE